MHLFSLPVEIFQQIMETTVASSVQQAMRARIVCKTFDVELKRALFTLKFLEMPKYINIDSSILSQYLFSLTKLPYDSAPHTVQAIHDAVNCLLKYRPQDEHQRNEYLQILCDLTVEKSRQKSMKAVLRCFHQKGLNGWNCTSAQHAFAAAAYLGLPSLCEAMIQEGARDRVAHFGTALQYAIKREDVTLVRVLLGEGGAMVSGAETYQAVRVGNREILQIVLGSKFSGDGMSMPLYHLSLLREAAATGQLETIYLLIQNTFSHLNPEDEVALARLFELMRQHDHPWDEMLLEATKHGHEHIVQAAFDHGASPLVKTCLSHLQWSGGLDLAALKGYDAIVQLYLARLALVSATACRDLRNIALQKALILAVKGGWPRIAQILLGAGAEIDWRNPYRYGGRETDNLTYVVDAGHPDMLKLLLDSEKAGLRDKLDLCQEGYALAASRGYTTMMRHFVEHGAVPMVVKK